MADAPLSSASTASRHLRELLVVDVHREIVGVLRDIDALQVVAAARRACA